VRAKSDKVRADHTASLLRAENESLTQKAEKLTEAASKTAALKRSFDEQLRKSAGVLQSKEEEVGKYEALVAQQKAALKDAQANELHAKGLLDQAKEAERRATEREEKAATATAAEATAVKRLTAERDSLTRRLGASSKGGGGKGGGGGGGSSLDEGLLELYRRKVKCSLCGDNDKDAIISKCMHSFCRECIQRRLDNRNRKCPACALQFDYQSVKDLFLTS
jgi:E3 ubiquitin-protein ligase BRE1